MADADRHLILAFDGTIVPDWLRHRLTVSPPAGVSLFREINTTSASQVAELTGSLQSLNSGPVPLLIAIDQEGGQLTGLVDSTPFAGNMALGATGDPDLTRRVAEAMGRELSAVGINLNYAPVADVASRPANPSLGVRSFGEDPSAVAAHVAAAVQGYRAAGILATLKHFPGKGEAQVDPHYQLPRLEMDLERLCQVELPPFASGFEAGAEIVMTGHYAVPALTGSEDLPVSMSEMAIDGFIRARMGFGGLVITDALDMGALEQGPAQVIDIMASMRGGTDLLLCMPDVSLQERARLAVERGVGRGLIPLATLEKSAARVAAVRAGLPITRLDPGVVGSHVDLAAELAERSVTLVRNDSGLIPLRLAPGDKVVVFEPEPTNVTPADTSALYLPMLAETTRERHPNVTSVLYPHDPEPTEIAALLRAVDGHQLVIAGTVNAPRGQGDLLRQLGASGLPLISVALREPQDLSSYPEVGTHVATYGSHRPSMVALVATLFGSRQFQGRLPVSIPRLYPIGHGL